MPALPLLPLLGALVPWALVGAAPAPCRALQDDAPAGPRVVLETLAGELRELPLVGFELADPRSAGATFVRFVGLERPRPPLPRADERAWVTLHGGDRLLAGVRGGNGEELLLTLHGGAPIDLSIEEIFSVVYETRLPRDGSVDLRPGDQGDRLYLRRGRGLDKLDGLVNGFDADGVLFEGRFGARHYPWSEIAALFIERLEERPVEAPPVPVIVDLEGGGRLSGGLLGLDAEGVRLATHGIADLRLPAALVREVALDDGSFRFLSALAPADLGPSDLFGGADDLGMRFPPRMDQNYRGEPLRSGGLEWSRGVGVHAPSRITWRLDGAWKELRGWVALDDSALENQFHGSAIFRVHVDGEVLWESPVVRGGDTPLAIPAIDLTQASELVLEVDAATEAFVSDRANWLRPILVRKQGARK